MMIAGYRQAFSHDVAGRRISGYRIYGFDRVDGVDGYMPAHVFLSSDTIKLICPSLDSLIGKEVVIRKDHFDRLCEFRVID